MSEKLIERPVRYRREQTGTLLQEFDDSKVKSHWSRHKKATVDLLELPVAVDRQLEDQKMIMEYNRNPRLHIPTKVDKVRSEQIIAKRGHTRDVTIKSKALNKIVREASGVHSYVIVPPPRMAGDVVDPDPDPETNPLVGLYAKETKKKPVIVSFGHRPSSASRVFNPGTMRIKMKHDEIAKAPRDKNKFDFGLPVGVLGKILRAPSIKAPGSMADEDEDITLGHRVGEYDPHDLFSLPPDSPNASSRPKQGFNDNNNHAAPAASMPTREDKNAMSAMTLDQDLGGSWVSGGGSRSGTLNSKGKKKTSIFTEKLSPMKEAVDPIDRPAWDTAHNVIPPSVRQAEIYRLKANHMNDQQLTLKERLVRYTAKTMADELTPYCTEKQRNDFTLLRSGSSAKDVQKSSAQYNHGVMALGDPLNGQLIDVKKKYVKISQELEAKHKAKDFQRSIQEIPKVAYHPTSLLTQMQTGAVTLKQIGRIARAKETYWEKDEFMSPDKGDDYSVASPDASVNHSVESGHSAAGSSVSGSYFAGSPAVKYDVNGQKLPEAKLYNAMKRAKYGDQRALYNTLMADIDASVAPAVDQFGSQFESLGSHFATAVQSTDIVEEAGGVEEPPLDHEIEGGKFFDGLAMESFESLSLNAHDSQTVQGKNLDEESTRHEKEKKAVAEAEEEVKMAEIEAEKEIPIVQVRPELQITVKSATGLAAANMFGGKSDPYCSIWDEAGPATKKDELFKTSHIDATLEPQWGDPPGSGDTFTFPLEELRPKTVGSEVTDYHDKAKFKTYRLEVHDYNKLTSGVFLGSVVVTPEHYHCEEGQERIEEYEWDLTAHSVKSSKENKLAQGQLRFSTRFVYKEV